MARDSKICVAELGTRSVTLAAFRLVAAGGLLLHSLTQEKLTADFPSKSSCHEHLKTLLREWREKEKIKWGERLTVGLASESLLIRFLKLPGTCLEDVQAIMDFEAQQNIPLPLNETVWDYQIIGPAFEGIWDVVLVATRKTVFSELKQTAMGAGFFLERVDAAPLALYNAFRFNYADAKGCSLIIECQMDSMNLIFSENEKLLIHTARFPGPFRNPSAADKFPEAVLLREWENSVERTQREIEHSIAFYCNHHGGALPSRIFICGTPEISGLQQALKEKMQIEVNIFNPLRNIQMTAVPPLASLGSIIGLATRELKNVPLEINLLSSESIREIAFIRKKPFLTASAFCLFLTLINGWLYFSKAIALKTSTLKNAEAQLSTLEIRAAEFQRLRSEKEQLTARLIPILEALQRGTIWPTLINALETSLPPKFIWITRLEPIVGNQPVLPSPSEWDKPRKQPEQAAALKTGWHLLIEGLYLENPSQAKVVDQFVHNLAALFSIPDKTQVIRLRDTPDGEHWAYRYSLILPLN
ncbi:MAG: hypothetical protein C5B47_03890 [Verrucomicrobia bacterium]|nr:MAG: hypothetical protein C5B47_03890 [Verrucomicrobiota bacterium]